jgi:hypothetical protein
VAEATINLSFHPEDRRLSLQKFRGLVGGSCKLSDEQLKSLRDQMYALAQLLISGYVKGKTSDYSSAAELGNHLTDVVSIPTVM